MSPVPFHKKKVAAIITAAGSGKRLGLKTPKPFIKILGKSLIEYSLNAFEKSRLVDSIILVVAKGLLSKTKRFIAKKKYKSFSKCESLQ